MKARKMLSRILFPLLVVLMLGDCATGKYVSKPNEELYGIWTNENPSNSEQIQKQVYGAGAFEEYGKVGDSVPVDQVTFQIDSKWTDASGSIWYRSSCKETTGPAAGVEYATLSRLSKSATVLEYVLKMSSPYGPISYPAQIDTANDTYHIFYRAKGH